jgi:hypothetical protein
MSTLPGKAMYTSFLEQIGAAYRPDRIKGECGAGLDGLDGKVEKGERRRRRQGIKAEDELP